MKIVNLLTGLTACMFTISLYAADEKEVLIKKEETAEVEKSNIEIEPAHTLFQQGKTRFSGYGAPTIRFSKFHNEYKVLVGGRGGLIINNNFVIGLGGCGIAGTFAKDVNDKKRDVGMGYGGVLTEYYLFPKSLLHISVGSLIGAGGAGYEVGHRYREDNYGHNHEEAIIRGGSFFVLEPEVNLFINLTRFARVGIGGTYRYTYGLNKRGLSDSDVRGFSASVMFAFGWF